MWRKAVGAAVEAELARRIAHRGVDAVLTTEKVAIQEEVRAAAQKRINDYRAGVQLSTVNIESVTPPAEAADAFRDVASARADTDRIVNEAEGYANDLIPKARGEAQQMTRIRRSLQAEEDQRGLRRRRALHAGRSRIREGGRRSPATVSTSRPWSRSCRRSGS